MTEPARYRKRPIEIAAMQWTRDTPMSALRAFANGLVRLSDVTEQFEVYDRLHDTWIAFFYDDFIIRGTAGEFYPCRGDVFAEVYEPAEPTAPDRAPPATGRCDTPQRE